MIEAYRKLKSSSNPNDPSDTWEDIKSAIADIQLLGTPEQVKLARKFADKMGDTNQASTMGLLINLRNTLREELKLESVTDTITILRFGLQHNQIPQSDA